MSIQEGLYINGKIVANKTVVEDSLNSDSPLMVLSARQGKVLNKIINEHEHVNYEKTGHKHGYTDINVDDDHSFITSEQISLISMLNKSGPGTKFLNDSGKYSLIKILDINDDNVSEETTYSSNKLSQLFNTKAESVHSHDANSVIENELKLFITKAEKDKLPYMRSTDVPIMEEDLDESFINRIQLIESGLPETYINDSIITDTTTFSSVHIESLLGGKAEFNHNHDELYALFSHNHDNMYSPAIHKHWANEIEETEHKRFVTDNMLGLINTIKLDGAGDKVLSNDGGYIALANAIFDDDTNIDSTWSSDKINTLLDLKSGNGHTHDDLYSTLNHVHDSEYSPLTHDHGKVYSPMNHNHDPSYSGKNHRHDNWYSLLEHNHNSMYSPLNHDHDLSYASLLHNHDKNYSSINHNHDKTYTKIIHSHNISDISLGSDQYFIDGSQKEKINSIVISGGGQSVLSDNGKYIPLTSAIFDDVIDPSSTWSSDKINTLLDLKSGNGHTHDDLYSSLIHTHESYALSDHFHNEVYSLLNHDHDKVYSLLGHVHDNLYAGKVHKHDAVDIIETIEKSFVSAIQINKIDKIITDGNGDKVLANNGNYMSLANAISDDVESINNTWSSQKISSLINLKANDTHDHNSLYAIIDHDHDETYSAFAHNHDDVYYTKLHLDAEIDGITKRLHEHLNKQDIDLITSDQIIKWNSTCSTIVKTGIGDLYLANNGTYKKVDDVKINDEVPSLLSVYSSDKVSNIIQNEIKELVLPSQNDSPTTWQKTFENVKSGDVLNLTTTDNFVLDKSIVQVFKYIRGDLNITEVLDEFKSTKDTGFYFNRDNVVIDTSLHIKDTHQIDCVEEDGYFISAIINKNDYAAIDDITVNEVI